MTGLPDYNYPEFYKMEEILEKMGYNVLNPARIANGEKNHPYDFYIRESLKLISNADLVIFLDGWEKSKGAQLEFHCAKTMKIPTLDKNFSEIISFDENSKSICEKADIIVSEDRMKQYGHPYHNFTDIGRVWGMILNMQDIPPEKVALMMIGLKIAREKFKPHFDNRLDTIGYAKTLDIIVKYKENIKDE